MESGLDKKIPQRLNVGTAERWFFARGLQVRPMLSGKGSAIAGGVFRLSWG